MRTLISIFVIATNLMITFQVNSQTYDFQKLDENWLNNKKEYFENFSVDRSYLMYRDQMLDKNSDVNFESSQYELKTKIEHDGLVTRSNKKYFILIQKPNLNQVIEIPHGKIDGSIHYHIREKEVE